eukprot:13937021-Ditylum_brightwellii.AAC.1
MNSSDAIAVNCHFSNDVRVFMPFTVRQEQLRLQAQLELNNPKSVVPKWPFLYHFLQWDLEQKPDPWRHF